VDRRLDPYAPGSGRLPGYLAGRDEDLEEFRVLVDRIGGGLGERSIVYSGLRGVGKTVLLTRSAARRTSPACRPVRPHRLRLTVLPPADRVRDGPGTHQCPVDLGLQGPAGHPLSSRLRARQAAAQPRRAPRAICARAPRPLRPRSCHPHCTGRYPAAQDAGRLGTPIPGVARATPPPFLPRSSPQSSAESSERRTGPPKRRSAQARCRADRNG
jgi:hypothetical protein